MKIPTLTGDKYNLLTLKIGQFREFPYDGTNQCWSRFKSAAFYKGRAHKKSFVTRRIDKKNGSFVRIYREK